LLTEFDVPRERVGPTITMGKVAFKFPPLLGGTEERERGIAEDFLVARIMDEMDRLNNVVHRTICN
jgi:hypothetical protein